MKGAMLVFHLVAFKPTHDIVNLTHIESGLRGLLACIAASAAAPAHEYQGIRFGIKPGQKILAEVWIGDHFIPLLPDFIGPELDGNVVRPFRMTDQLIFGLASNIHQEGMLFVFHEHFVSLNRR